MIPSEKPIEITSTAKTTTSTLATSTSTTPKSTTSNTPIASETVKSQLIDEFTNTLDSPSYKNDQSNQVFNRRSDVPLNSRPFQQPLSSEAIAERYYAKILASRDAQSVQFVPCMCPISLSTLAGDSKQRTDDLEITEFNGDSIDRIDTH